MIDRVAMIGPVPPRWGGGGRWTGGGVATHLGDLVPALASRGLRVRVLAENANLVPSNAGGAADGWTVEPITRGWPSLLRWGGGSTPGLAARLLAPVAEGRRVPSGQALRYLGLAINYRRFLATRPPPLIHVHGARHGPYLCRRIIDCRLPMVVTAHSVNRLVEPGPAWLRTMVRANLARVDHVIAVSTFVARRLRRFGARSDRITVIHNGVDTDRFAPGDEAEARRRLDLPADSTIVLFTGNLVPRKGVHHLIAALAQSPVRDESTLIIVGDGPERSRLAELAYELGVVSAVSFVGRRPLGEMAAWYRACDVFVLPSSAEGLSISLLEAMSCARPVITTRPSDGGHDAVTDGETGLLVESGDAPGLARALELVLGDPERASGLAVAARRAVESRFTWDRIARQTIDLYHRVMEEAGEVGSGEPAHG
jgi:glycosyltransferase involved in cell wall biosynthesis